MSESRNLLEPTEEQIRERAYKIYLAGGSEDGHDLLIGSPPSAN